MRLGDYRGYYTYGMTPKRWFAVVGIIAGAGLLMAGYWALRTAHAGQHVCGTREAVLIQSAERPRDTFRRPPETVRQQIAETAEGLRYMIVGPDMSRAVGDRVLLQLHCNTDGAIMRTASIALPVRE